MTKEQYDKVKPYKPICDLFAETGSYIGGADGLFELYKDMFNGGLKVNTSCANCMSAVLLDIHYKTERYEQK